MGPKIPGLEHVISSNEAFHLTELPKRIVIQGGGYIAVEFAGIFAGLGSEVTLVYRGENILRGFDDDVREHLRARDGAARHQDHHAARPWRRSRRSGDELRRRSCPTASTIVADQVMFAIGRRPNVHGLGLEAAASSSTRTAASRSTSIRAPRCRTSTRSATSPTAINLTPVAIREGHAFADTVFGGKPTAVDHSNVPTAVFSEPEVGVIGLTEAQARERLAKRRHLQDHASGR